MKITKIGIISMYSAWYCGAT